MNSILRETGRTAALFLCVIFAGRDLLNAQTLPSSSRSEIERSSYQPFDIVSVKPATKDATVTDINADALGFYCKNVNVKLLLKAAYGMQQGKIYGLPKWAEDSKWDVRAKVSSPDPALQAITPSSTEAMKIYQEHVLSILTSRFHLKAHTEQRIADVYQLETERGVTKIHETNTPETEQGMFGRTGDINGRGVTMQDLANELSLYVSRDVLDDTHLKNKYDLELKWQPNEGAGPSVSSDEAELPSLSGALKEQLNLKLAPAKGTIAVLVVDSIEMPSRD
jgi:uncharacterized protein (TIGR03435 family)